MLTRDEMSRVRRTKHEARRGSDVLHFKDGKIIQKLTYSKTTVELDGERVRLTP